MSHDHHPMLDLRSRRPVIARSPYRQAHAGQVDVCVPPQWVFPETVCPGTGTVENGGGLRPWGQGAKAGRTNARPGERQGAGSCGGGEGRTGGAARASHQ